MSRREDIAHAIRNLAPRIPQHEFNAVLDHSLDSMAIRTASPETAAWLSLVAYVRHVHTDYDELLASGYDFESARHFTVAEINAVLQAWGVRRSVAQED